MSRIITIASQKGGSGKTSLLIHLAVALAQRDRKVAVIDSDPQASLSHWIEQRAEDADPSLTHAQAEGWKVTSLAQQMGRKADIVLIDTPPHAETAARTAMRVASLVLVPLQPSPMDLWAGEATLAIAKAEKVLATVILNRVPPRSKLIEASRDTLAAHTLCPVEIGNRTAFAAALMQGQGVTEAAPRTKAADEIRALADYLLAS